jgi:anti-sigma factor RsiW
MQNITCDTCQERLSAYLDHELDQALEREVAAHLESCADCAREFQQLQQLGGLLGDLSACADEPALDVEALIRKTRPVRVVQAPTFKERLLEFISRPWTWGPAMALAAATVLVFLALPPRTPHGPEYAALQPASAASSAVESVSSDGGVLMLQTAQSGQPLIWILPEQDKEATS